MPNIEIYNSFGSIPKNSNYHLLIVAEVGFSMLDNYARHQYNISRTQIQEFADKVTITVRIIFIL